MFILGFIVGAVVIAAVFVALVHLVGRNEESPQMAALLARRRIDELERQTIARMLREAEIQRGFGGDFIESDAS